MNDMAKLIKKNVSIKLKIPMLLFNNKNYLSSKREKSYKFSAQIYINHLYNGIDKPHSRIIKTNRNIQ